MRTTCQKMESLPKLKPVSGAEGPAVLVILDGWGAANPRDDFNAVAIARTPNYDALLRDNPHFKIETSGLSVGVPPGQMGNSEIGHYTIGAGRIIDQPLVRINKSIEDGSFSENENLLKACQNAKENDSALHLMGLVSDGGVHSDIDHLYALLKLARDQGLTKVYVHAFLDGRDTPPKVAKTYVEALEAKMRELGIGEIATIVGRHYAMDRDGRGDRTKLTYDAMVLGKGKTAKSAMEAIDDAYKDGEDDEHTTPRVIVKRGRPIATIKEKDSVIFSNFRSDRARQITRALVDRDFDGFDRESLPKVHFVCMTQYEETLDAPVAFPPQEVSDVLAEVLSRNGKRVLKISETEKYAHVTYFLNGGKEEPFENEDRILIPSAKVGTYENLPRMSADEVTDVIIDNLGKQDVIVVNYANCDMVGHTGRLSSSIEAVEATDECLGKLVKAVGDNNGSLIVIADHGNAEQKMNYRTGEPQTKHSTGVVRGIVVTDRDVRVGEDDVVGLYNVAPTLLDIADIERPAEMRESLLSKRTLKQK